MNTANWIPDLFMRRVMEKGSLDAVLALQRARTCTTSSATPSSGLCRLRGRAARGELKPSCRAGHRPVAQDALDAVRDRPSLDHLQDACNIRSPQQHVGVVHSSNLCTEITLNTSDTETAVCNLGSVNLAQHLTTARSTMPS